MESEQGGYASTGQVIDRYRELSLAKYETGEKLDLIIWPETAYPFAVKTNKEDISYSYTPSVFNEVAQTQDAEMLVGGYDIKNSDHNETLFKTEYNTAFQVSKSGKLKNSYHKQILIPFGETLPFGSFINELLSKYIENISFFSEGEKFTLFNLDSGHKLITTICYELLKPEFIRSYLNSLNERPHAMINLTNDSWYGDTMEPEQHLFLAKWRALEFNLPIIRSTNTGITSVIYPDGSESKRLEVLKTGNLDLSINLPLQEATFYQKFGFATILPLWIIYLIFHLLLLKLKHDK
jgi:apolipoprotein N-acyltransferase